MFVLITTIKNENGEIEYSKSPFETFESLDEAYLAFHSMENDLTFESVILGETIESKVISTPITGDQ